MVLGASNCTPENRHVDDLLAADRALNRLSIETCIERAIISGELAHNINVHGLATVFHTFLMGIALEARDGVHASHIDEAVTALLRIWDLHKTP